MCRWEEGVPDAETLMIRRRPSLKALVGFPPPPPSSPRSPFSGAARFFCEAEGEEERRHFLDSCSLCRRPLTADCDIYMYKGDTPFCSEECRGEQMEVDELRERGRRRVRAAKGLSASSRVERHSSVRAMAAAGTVTAG